MYTKVPNALIEAMPTMKGSVIAVCMAVCRQTLGYQRLWDRISTSQFIQLTGMSNRSIIDAIETAVADGWIIRKRDGDSYQYTLKGAEEILSYEKTSHKEIVKTNKNAILMCEETTQEQMSYEKTSQEAMNFLHTQKKEINTLSNDSVPAEPHPPLVVQVRSILDRMERAKPYERQAILLEAYKFCFGERADMPSFGYLGKVAKDVGGAGHLVEIMCSLTARPPTGDPLAYILATHKSKASRNGRNSNEVDLMFLLNQGSNNQ